MTGSKFYSMPEADYFGVKAASNSTLGKMKRSPAHCKEAMDNPMEQTANMRLGSITHKLSLEGIDAFNDAYYIAQEYDPVLPRRLTDIYETVIGGQFDFHYMVDDGSKVSKPRGKAGEIAERMAEGDAAEIRKLYTVSPEVNKKTKEGKAKYAEFEAKCEREGLTICKQEDLDKACEYIDWLFTLNDRELVSESDITIIENYKNFVDFVVGDKEVIKQEEYDLADAMRDALHTHPAASKLLTGGKAEVSLFWDDADTGYPCKSRMDYLRDDDLIVDLKTTTDASLSEFSRSIAKFGYHRQDAMYSDGFEACFDKRPKGFVFIAVETKPPHAVGVYTLDPESADKGREEYKNLLVEFAACMESGEWPAYSDKIETIELPAWYK